MKKLTPLQRILAAKDPKIAKKYPDLGRKYKALQAVYFAVKDRTLVIPQYSKDSNKMGDAIIFGWGGPKLTDIGVIE